MARSIACVSSGTASATRHSGLQTPTDSTGSNQLKDLHWIGQPFDGKLPQGVDLDKSLDQSEGRCR